MLLVILRASSLGELLNGKVTITSGKSTIKAGQDF